MNILREFVFWVLLGLAVVTSAQDFGWNNVRMGGGGFVSAIVASHVEENLYYARTDVGGAYRWDHTTQSWVSIIDWVNSDERGLLGVEAIAVDPKTAGCVYMMTGTSYWNQADDGVGRSAFLRSCDYGSTWEKIPTWDNNTKFFNVHGNGMGRGNGEALAIDPNNANNMFYGSKNKGLWKSTNKGSTWSHVDAFTAVSGSDTTWNGSGFSFVTYAPGSSTTLYAGFLREGSTSSGTFENVFTSTDGGNSWVALPIPNTLRSTAGGAFIRLMPQRAVVASDHSFLIVTFGDGAGPHTMAWDEGWGMIYDGFGRGAVLKYDVAAATWSDISPDDFVDQWSTGASKYDSVNVSNLESDETSYQYLPPYAGISINPNNDLEMVITTEGYGGAQYWYNATADSWSDQWGTQIYYTADGGASWYQSFKYQDSPDIVQMSENGIGWMANSSIHWSGSIVINPFNSKQVWVTSGNGVFRTDDITAFSPLEGASLKNGGVVDPWAVTMKQQWKVVSHGIEETVPEEVVSIPGGPMISVIGDYDGFRHDAIIEYPAFRHRTNVGGSNVALGSTRGLAYAPLSGTLVKVCDRRVYEAKYNDIPIDPIQISTDSGRTWTVTAYNVVNGAYAKGTVAISADGAVILWTPAEGTTVVQRYFNSAWTTVSGVDGAYIVGDPQNASIFYAYDKSTGALYKSTDKGETFSAVGSPGISNFKKMRLVPGREGDLWVPIAKNGTGGLMRSTDGGATFAAVANVGYCEAVGFGAPAQGHTYPSVYLFGNVGGVLGVFQSDDEGATWTRINDDAHEYGGLANGEFVMGDMNTYGVVYMSTAGRGIAARMPADWLKSMAVPVQPAPETPLNNTHVGGAILRHDQLFLQPGHEMLHVQLIGLNGRIVYEGRFQNAQVLPLRSLIPCQGVYVVLVQSTTQRLLAQTAWLQP